MDSDPRRPKPPRDVTQLFAEYLTALESGEEPEVDALCARAGESAEELRERIRAYELLQELGATLASDGEPGIPRRVGRYRVEALIGRGGLSRVYAAVDTELDRKVALKILDDQYIPVASARDWMVLEGRTLASLVHANVVQVFEVGEHAGSAFIAMQYVEGPSVAAMLDELRARRAGGRGAGRSDGADVATPGGDDRGARDRLAREAADRYAGIGARAELALRIARAIAACHAAKVVHRDIKPGNVLLDGGVTPKLIDFGLAHLERDDALTNQVTHRLVGTPAYMAPEQFESGRTGRDQRTDQFSFGVFLYELLTLENPFQRSTRTEIVDAVTQAVPQPLRALDPAIPADLQTICLHALERTPSERYPSMDALADDLEAFLDHRAIGVSPPSVSHRLRLWVRRNRRDLQVAGVPAVLILTGVIALYVRGEWKEAKSLAAEFHRAESAVAHLKTPADFTVVLQRLNALRSRARENDSSIPRGWLQHDRVDDAEALIEETSRRLHVALEDMWSRTVNAVIGQRRALQLAQFIEWKSALAFESDISPDSTWNTVDRSRGTIVIGEPPTGFTLLHQEQISDGTPYGVKWIPASASGPLAYSGLHRFTLLDLSGDVLSEIDAVVSPVEIQRVVRPSPIREEFRSRLIDVLTTATETPHGVIQPFRLLPVWLTLAELNRIVGDIPGLAARLTPGCLDLEEPRDPHSHPQLYAADVLIIAEALGMRLPTLAEALLMQQIAREGRAGSMPLVGPFVGEHLTGLTVGAQRPTAEFKTELGHSVPGGIDEFGVRAKSLIAFRFVCSSRSAP